MIDKLKIIAIVLFLFPLMLVADRIRLKNGRLIKGTVVKQKNGLVTIKLDKPSHGKNTIRIWKKDIVSMLYVEPKRSRRRRRKTKRRRPARKQTAKQVRQNNRTSQTTANSNNQAVIQKEKVTEKITVDKELTDNVMQKFEDADKRREKSIQSEIDVLQDELEYLKAEKERLKKNNDDDEKFRKLMDKRMSGLEIRIRRLEKYLGMDESMVEYYQQKRSPWDLVKRSAIFPGWGHRYARQEYTGNTYSTLFITFLVLGYFIDYQAEFGKETVNNTFETKMITQSLQMQAFPGLSSGLSNSALYSVYGSYKDGMDAVNSQKKLAGNFYTAAFVLYGMQLVHAYFTGVEWAKSKPRDYSNEELMRPVGWDLNIQPDYHPYRQEISGTHYNISYIHRF